VRRAALVSAALFSAELRRILSRLTRALEALEDGDPAFAEQVLVDLAADVWAAIERQERAA